MKLLKTEFTTAASTIAGSTKGLTTVVAYGAQHYYNVDKIVVMTGGTTIAPDGTDGLVGFRYGDSSGQTHTTIAVCPQPLYVGGAPGGIQQVSLEGLGIRCKWFEAVTRTTCAGGVGVFIFGD